MSAVLVTGASAGIGREVAAALAERGEQVLLVARRAHALEESRAALPGDGHRVLALDVGDQAAWAAAAGDLEDVGGVVCAAGVLGPIGEPGAYEPAAFAATLHVNLLGTLLAVHHCLPSLRRLRGAIVTFSGGGATAPLPRFDAYAASKAAVVRLTENLAAGLAEAGVRANSVAPGFVATDMHRATLEAGPDAVGAAYYERTRRDLAEGGVPARRAAELVAFLLSRDAAAITGKLISAQWDPWEDPAFRERLAGSPDLATLRRIDDMFFTSVPT